MKIIIIGGVAGGATAAARLRRLDEKAEIVIFERGNYISYANCGLPYYIGEEIKERGNIILQSPQSFKARFNVDVRVRQEVTYIDRAKKQVTVKDLAAGKEYSEPYDKLVLSPGAGPLVPPIPGVQCGRIFTLRNIPDADAIKAFIDEHHPRRAVVVGAGYIGLEMAENLHRRGIFVTLIEMAPQVIAPLDFEMAALVHQHLKTKDVEFYLGEQVVAFSECGDGMTITLKSGIALAADMAILSIGIRPDVALAKSAGLATGPAGGITVNDYLQTSDPDIYAVGDAVEAFDSILNTKRLIPLAGPANKQARIAANNIVRGNTEKYRGSAGTAIAKVFDLTVGVTGYSERALKEKKVPYASVILHSVSHAGYYPGAVPLSMKINFSSTDGTLYGAQVVGYDGADKAADVFSMVCECRGTIHELKNMDQAYAPPYSSAKSPVNMAGFVADNVLSGMVKVKSWSDVQGRGEDVFLLDVRTQTEVAVGTIPGSYHIPVDQLRQRLAELPRGKRIYVYCASGLRSYVAARILTQNGYEAYNISGGYKTWENAIMKQSNEDIYEKYRVAKDDMIYLKGAATPPAGTMKEIDARGMQCPGPIMRLNEKMQAFNDGDVARVTATDPGFLNDVKSWCAVTGNRLISVGQEAKDIVAVIQKGTAAPPPAVAGKTGNDKTIIVFDDDFDRALAAFVIANGALAMGRKVTMFFTFWGLNILKKKSPPPVHKDFISRMFSFMLPRGNGRLRLSKLNMLGIGPLLMNRIMKRKNIDTLEVLMDKALKGGAVLIACQMSMDVMGIKKEELIDGIRYGGVASYIEAAESASTNLFI